MNENYFKLNECRYRGLFGNINYWYGWCKPIFEDVLKKWQLGENFSNETIKKTSEFLGIDHNFKSENSLNDYENFEIKFSDTNNLIKRLYREVEQNKNLSLILNSQVIKIELLENKYELTLIHNEKKIKIICKFLIIGAGCFENSRLLLYSKIHSINNFLYSHKCLGKNFYDNIQLESGEFVADQNRFLSYFDKNFKNSDNELFQLRNKKLIDNKKSLNHTVTLTFKNHPDKLKDFVRKSLCVSSKFNDKISKKLNDFLCLRGILINLTPSERNNSEILLSNKKFDKNGINQINLNYSWRNDEQLRKTYENVTKEFLKDLVKHDLGRGYLFNFKKYSDNNNLPGSSYHPSGGTCIGSNVSNGCVDKNLEVFNHKNLYVLGSSVFPKGVVINPTYSIVLLSHRLADRLSSLI